jgi:DNA polymerase III delta prime subunit
MNSLPLSKDTMGRVTSALARTGVVTVPSVFIGAAAEPAAVDVVLVETQDGTEVWLPEPTSLPTGLLEQLPADRPVAGGGRLLFSQVGGVDSALARLDDLLDHPRPRHRGVTDVAAVEALRQDAAHRDPNSAEVTAFLSHYISGQTAAIATIAGTVVRHLRRPVPRHPTSMLFVGPTGCGKTETARRLAAFLRDFGFQPIIINANEYSEPHRISQLLGAPAGYVGHESGGTLVDHLAANSRSLPIIDEVEKAHPVLLDTLMNALSAGTMTRSGRAAEPVDCRHAIFVFTSNLISAEVEAVTQLQGQPASRVSDLCRKLLVARGMRPEVAGRFTAVVPFQPLSAGAEAEAAARVVVDLADEYGVWIEWVAPALVATVLDSREVEFGARSIKAAADELLGDVFAETHEQGHLGPFELVGPPWRLERSGKSAGRGGFDPAQRSSPLLADADPMREV